MFRRILLAPLVLPRVVGRFARPAWAGEATANRLARIRPRQLRSNAGEGQESKLV